MKPLRLRFLVIAAVSLAMFAATASSRAAGAKAPKDGLDVPKSDLQKQRELDKYDTNHDGKIDEFERAAMARDKRQQKKDDKTEKEAALLEKYDLNHDGKLDASEKAAMKADQEKAGAEPKSKKKPDEKAK